MPYLAEVNMDSYKITFQTWNKIASIYQDNFMDIDLYDDTYDTFCELTEKKKAKIFEIGCGPGNITKYMLAKRPDFKIEAIDVAPNMIKLAETNNPAASFTIMDCRDIGRITFKYDGVMCGFCIPYLSKEDVVKLINDCSYLLNRDGVFYLSALEGDYNKSGYETGSNGIDSMYVYYHQETYLEEQLKINGFESIDIKRKNYIKRDGTTSTHIIFIAKKA
jgi:predicted TPR repeat methyltransferase